jgi:hypothetical protein
MKTRKERVGIIIDQKLKPYKIQYAPYLDLDLNKLVGKRHL